MLLLVYLGWVDKDHVLLDYDDVTWLLYYVAVILKRAVMSFLCVPPSS
jgi:hypothetical protein